MKNLQELVKNLNKSEKKMVRKFLSTYSSNGKSNTMGLKLFDILDRRKKALSNKDCGVILFGKDEKNRIRVLKSRLKHRILDALLVDMVINNQKIEPDSKTAIKLRKKMVQCQTLIKTKKGNLTLINSLLNEIVKKATELELYKVLIEALDQQKFIIGFRQGLEVYEKYEHLSNIARTSDNAEAKIVSNYYKMLLLYRPGNYNKETMSNFFKKSSS